MKRILHVIHGLNLGGAETFIYNLLEAIDHSRYRFDFVIQEPEIKYHKFAELIHASGGKIHIIPDFIHNPIAHYRAIKRVVADGKYDYVHIHMNAFINPLPTIAASKYNNKIIIHSHSTNNGKGGIIGKWLHHINCRLFLQPSFKRLCCSNMAGRWMFGNKSSIVVCNALSPKRYAYNKETASKLREKYGLGDAFVIGQVGRLIPLKNQSFTIKLFKKFIERHPKIDSRLMIVGDGLMRQELEQLCLDLGLSDKVIFTGNIHNVSEIYSAFDTLVMPSLFEGLSFVGIEAQAAGLKTVISDTVTPEINTTNTVSFCSLENSEQWLTALECAAIPYERNAISDLIIGSSFDIQQMLTTMEKVYE